MNQMANNQQDAVREDFLHAHRQTIKDLDGKEKNLIVLTENRETNLVAQYLGAIALATITPATQNPSSNENGGEREVIPSIRDYMIALGRPHLHTAFRDDGPDAYDDDKVAEQIGRSIMEIELGFAEVITDEDEAINPTADALKEVENGIEALAARMWEESQRFSREEAYEELPHWHLLPDDAEEKIDTRESAAIAYHFVTEWNTRANPSPPAEEVKMPVPSDVVEMVVLSPIERQKLAEEIARYFAGYSFSRHEVKQCLGLVDFLCHSGHLVNPDAIAAMPSHDAAQKLIDLKAENERLRADLEHALDTVKAIPEQRDALLDLADRIQELHKICIEKGIIHDKY